MEPAPGLHLVGASHHTAPLEIRERLTLDDPRRNSLYERLAHIPQLTEAVVLSTCNRVEVYGVTASDAAREALRAHYCAVTGLPHESLPRYGLDRSGREAARHLMEVCSGLDSQMVGETEILGQAKQAYADAMARGTAGPVIHRLFQKSFQAAKWVRTQTGIGLGQLSLGSIAADLARRIYGDLSQSRVLLVGTGKVGADVARSLAGRGVSGIVVTSRNAGKSDYLATSVGGSAIPFGDWPAHLHRSDIVICCTSAPEAVLTRRQVAAAIGHRPARPLFLIDLAVPRDIEAAAAHVPNTFLYTFDDLAALANENLKGRVAEIEACRHALSERADRLWEELCNRSAQPGNERTA